MFHYFQYESEYGIIVFTLDKDYMIGEEFMGLPVVAFDEIEINYPPDLYEMFIAIGYTKTNKVRADKYSEARAKGYTFANFINSSAIKSKEVTMGTNCIVFEGTIVQPFVNIGNGVMLWSGGYIGHHSVLHDYCFIAPRAARLGVECCI
jgi:UDP-3-O-[3-hydroxymyristoyl] glucosamine N-acyltransferase